MSGAGLPALRAALRIARRDAWRSKGRSLLVIILIGLPVLVLSAVDVGWRTYQLSAAQSLTREIGAADLAAMSAGDGSPVQQRPKGWLDNAGYTTGKVPAGRSVQPPTAAALLKALPRGSRLIAEIQGTNPLAIRTHAGVDYVSLIGFDYADPIARGLVTQLDGRAPRTAGEAAITSRMAHDTGLRVGDTMRTFDGSRSFRIVGVVQDSHNRGDVDIYSLPAAVAGAGGITTWLARTPAPVSWAGVLRLDRLGFVSISRQAYLHPPPESQIAYKGYVSPGTSTSTEATVGLLAGLALLEVVLLAGPAFAVSARRQRHDLALIAASGGRRRDLRNVVLSNGIVLGLSAGVASVVCGVGLVAAFLAGFGSHIDRIPGPFDVRPLELAGLALVSLVTALLAALFPAWAAARTDVVAALAGQRGQARIKRRVPVLGLAVTVVGVVVALLGAGAGRNVNLILAGVVITEAGLIVLTPTLITLTAALGRRLPFAPRLALRDAARNRSSSSPAVAAVMASMIGAIAVAIVATSQTDLARREYQPTLPTNVAFVPTYPVPAGQPQPPTVRAVTAALQANLATDRIVTVRSPGLPPCSLAPVAGKPCDYPTIELVTAAQPTVPFPRSGGTERFHGGIFDRVMVDDGSSVSALFGEHLPQAEAALRAGHAVIADPGPVHDGTITLVASTGLGTISPSDRRLTLPAVVVAGGFPAAEVIIPPSVSTRLLGYAPQAQGVLAVLKSRPTTTQRQAMNESLAELQAGLSLSTEDGFQSSSQWELYALVAAAAVIALGAAAVATALANVDGRADLVTLGAVGASPRTRRLVSMSRAGVISGLGCVIGVAAGFVPAVAWVDRQRNGSPPVAGTAFSQLRLVVPWPEISIAAIGVPLVAVVVTGLVTRSRLPSERRVD